MQATEDASTSMESHVVDAINASAETAKASFQFDLSCQEEAGCEAGDAPADEGSIPSPMEAQCDSDSDDEEDSPIQKKTTKDHDQPKVPSALIGAMTIGEAKQSKALASLLDSVFSPF